MQNALSLGFKWSLLSGAAAAAITAHAQEQTPNAPPPQLYISKSAQAALGPSTINYMQQAIKPKKRHIAVISTADMESRDNLQTPPVTLRGSLLESGVPVQIINKDAVNYASSPKNRKKTFIAYTNRQSLCIVVVPSPQNINPPGLEFLWWARLPVRFRIQNPELKEAVKEFYKPVMRHEAEHCDQPSISTNSTFYQGYVNQQERGSDHALLQEFPLTGLLVHAARSMAPLHDALKGNDDNIHATAFADYLSREYKIGPLTADTKPDEAFLSKASRTLQITTSTYNSLARKIAARTFEEKLIGSVTKNSASGTAENISPPASREASISDTGKLISEKPEFIAAQINLLLTRRALDPHEMVAARLYLNALTVLNGKPAVQSEGTKERLAGKKRLPAKIDSVPPF